MTSEVSFPLVQEIDDRSTNIDPRKDCRDDLRSQLDMIHYIRRDRSPKGREIAAV
jgi:hypothetical protein